MNTVVFDVGGIVTYPGFERNIIKPLEKKGTNIFFWTFLPREWARELFLQTNLHRYWYKIIDIDDSRYFEKRAEEGRWDELSNYFHRHEDLKDIDFKPNLEHIKREGKNWLEAANNITRGIPIFKFPPLVAEGNTLLVESDEPVYMKEIKTLYLSHEHNLIAAQKYNYSCIIVPEHPYIWENINPRQKPEDVRKELKKELLSWQGEYRILDLGEKLGMYREHLPRGQERR